MEKIKSEDILGIYIPPCAESKILSKTERLLDNKELLDAEINKNIFNLSREQQEYLKSLLHLEISIFHNDELNEKLVGNPLFFNVSRYNLYEGLLNILSQVDEIDKDNIVFHIGIPEGNWLDLKGFTKSGITAFSLLEIEMYLKRSEITIYDCAEYNDEADKNLREYYKKQGRSNKEVEFWLEENRQKRNSTKIITNEILNYWRLLDFEDNISYDENVKGKILSWTNVYKKNL